jgi:hypothetical protein
MCVLHIRFQCLCLAELPVQMPTASPRLPSLLSKDGARWLAGGMLRRRLTENLSGGPHIDFRGGRVDATEAGPPGVPQSQDSLKSHTAAFARIGFSPKEMIQLVACGHTIGGVQRAAFPDIVPEKVVSEKYNPDGNVVFDQTFAAFDNHMYVLVCGIRASVATETSAARWSTCLAARSTRSSSGRT